MVRLKTILVLFFTVILHLQTQMAFAKDLDKQMFPSISKMETLKILSWNIFMLPVLGFRNLNKERALKIAESLQHSSYHVLVFQEAFSGSARSIISHLLKEAYPFQYGPANQGFSPFRTNSGLWILSRFPMEMQGECKFRNAKGFDAVARKGAVLFKGTFRGQEFQLAATHLQADGKQEMVETQIKQIHLELLQKYHEEGTPQIICGDFNIESTDKLSYDKMLEILHASDREPSGDLKYTYDMVNNTLVANKSDRKKLIDYILVRNEWLLHKIESKVKVFYSNIGDKIHHLSDHYALEAEIDFQGEQALTATL